MKKTLALTTVVIITLSALCAGALAALEPSDVIGNWYLNSIMYGETPMSAATLGMEMTMELNEDNTAVMVMEMSGVSNSTSGTWVIAGEEVILTQAEGGGSQVLTLVNGSLSSEQDDGGMVFGRERIVEEPIVIAPVRTDAVLADFNGEWTAYLAESAGMMLPADVIGFEATLTIEDGKVTLAGSGFGESQQLEGDVSEGALTAVQVDAGGGTFSMSFNLHEDGTVSSVFLEAITLYFQKAD